MGDMAGIEVLLDEPGARINPNIYGHFAEHLGACVYQGLWCDGKVRQKVVELVRRLRPAVIRWPGGCFADDYHWRHGVGPPQQRPLTINLHWGQDIETNAFGTHEFMDFCRSVGAEPYLCGNMGSGSPAELRDWLEYCNFDGDSSLARQRLVNGSAQPFGVKYWALGNESWGCGGAFSPEDYAGEFRRYSTFMPDIGPTPLYLIACGPDGNNVQWTQRFMERLKRDGSCHVRLHGYAPHYYCGTAGTATEYDDQQWYELLIKAQRMEELIVHQRRALDEFDPQRRIGLCIDEWGTWHPPTPGRNPRHLWQQNTLRDAMVAAITLDIFNRHADKVAMANIAQLINVLQAPLLAEGDQVLATPTYHVYELYQNHQGATSVPLVVQSDDALAGGTTAGSASLRGRTLTLTVTNPAIGQAWPARITLRGGSAALVRQTVLTHDDLHAHNTFEQPHMVQPGPSRVLSLSGQCFEYVFAPQSITRLEIAVV